MRSQASRVGLRAAAAGGAPLLIGAVLAGVAFHNQVLRARIAVDADVRAGAASSVIPVEALIDAQRAAAQAGPGPGTIVVEVNPTVQVPASPDVLVQARDTGTAVLDESVTPPWIVVPLYTGQAVPGNTTARRAALHGYRLVPLTFMGDFAALAPDGGGLSLRGPSRVVREVPRSQPRTARSFSVSIDAADTPGWSLVTWLPDPGIPASAWTYLLTILVGFIGLAGYLVRRVRHDASLRASRALVERDSRLLAELAPLLQGSLDLADVIPAVAAHLCDGLGLAGLSLSRPAAGGELPIFIWGQSPSLDIQPPLTLPEHLPEGDSCAFALSRGGRVLGTMRVVGGPNTTQAELLTLSRTSELLASTLANAETFTQQRALVQRMRAVDELKTVFLATASHELRTPIVAMMGFSSLLLSQWGTVDPKQGRMYVERIEANARMLDALVEDLLDFSRLERGMHPQVDELVDLGATVRRMLDEHPDLTIDHLLTLNLPAGLTVRGSVVAIERILTNLVGNAAKYSPAGTTITVAVHPDEAGAVLLVVDDEGPGVAPQDRERVFSRFFRGSGDVIVRTRGAGIGLAIVAEFAASMSGVATCGQAPSGGARFTVSFPLVGPSGHHQQEGLPHVPIP